MRFYHVRADEWGGSGAAPTRYYVTTGTQRPEKSQKGPFGREEGQDPELKDIQLGMLVFGAS